MVTIGNMFTLFNPPPTKYEVSRISIIETEVVVVIMRSTYSLKSVPAISKIVNNSTRIIFEQR